MVFCDFHLLLDNFYETPPVATPGFNVHYVTGHFHFLLPGAGCMTNLGLFKTILLISWEKGSLTGSVSSNCNTLWVLVRNFRGDFLPCTQTFLTFYLCVCIFFSLSPSEISFLGLLLHWGFLVWPLTMTGTKPFLLFLIGISGFPVDTQAPVYSGL